jgi:hypothetical protein
MFDHAEVEITREIVVTMAQISCNAIYTCTCVCVYITYVRERLNICLNIMRDLVSAYY